MNKYANLIRAITHKRCWYDFESVSKHSMFGWDCVELKHNWIFFYISNIKCNIMCIYISIIYREQIGVDSMKGLGVVYLK